MNKSLKHLLVLGSRGSGPSCVLWGSGHGGVLKVRSDATSVWTPFSSLPATFYSSC